MGKRKASFNTTRSEFTSDNNFDNNLDYSRSGGCFVTTKKAIAFVILAVLALVAVGVFIYFYGKNINKKEEELSADIEKLINDSINNANKQQRLPIHITPLHYRLRIHPYLDEQNEKNFTFSGRVTIIIETSKSTNQIVLNSEFLDISEIDVITTTSLTLRSHVAKRDVSKSIEPEAKNSTKLGAVAAVNSSLTANNTQLTPKPGPNLTITSTTTTTVASVPKVIGLETTSIANKKLEPEPNTFAATLSPVFSKPKIEKTIYLPIKSHDMDAKKGLLVINLRKKLKSDTNYTIDIKFSGKILNNLVGLFKTSYSGRDKRVKWLLSTHLQPVFARRVFPCFDEPSFKSIFEISIARRTNMTSLSNMPRKDVEPLVGENKGWVWDHFEESRPMPTYLVAFTVFDFKKLEPTSTKVGPVFNMWAPEEKLNYAKYAIDISPKIFSYLQDYFGVNYPLSKIDLVALPELPQKATDNWGIILFRESSLLNATDNWKIKNNIFKTIARKLCTQWFGNLVTMNWWSEMWLIEGFSTFMQDIVETAIDPALEDLDDFPLRITQTILETDQLKYVRSLGEEIEELNQIEQLFDDVAINKGSCVIRMLYYTLGADLFKKGVQNYLQNWAFKCSDEDHFWASFTNVSNNQMIFPSNLTVKEFMNSWITQEGYPVITVTRNYMSGNAIINQSRFVQSNATYDTLWYVPLTYSRKGDNGTVSTLWLEKEKSLNVLNLTSVAKDLWIVFNIEQSGFYRVNYDTRNWNLIQQQLMTNHTEILPSNRGQLLNDAFELAYAGLLEYKIAFELTKYLKMERNYRPWHSLFNSLRSLEHIIGSTPYNGAFQDYIINLIHPIFLEIKLPPQNQTQHGKLLDTFMLQVSCGVKYQPCVSWAIESYRKWMNSSNPDVQNLIDFDVRELVQCTAIKSGGQKEWEFLWDRTRYPFISSADLKTAYETLGCTQEPWIINSYLERSLNGSIGVQYVPEVWKSISHPVGLKTGFAFVRENWERIYERFHDNIPVITTIFEEFLSKLSTSVDLEDLTSFYKLHKDNLQPVSALMLNVVNRIKQRVDWSNTHLEEVSRWFSNN